MSSRRIALLLVALLLFAARSAIAQQHAQAGSSQTKPAEPPTQTQPAQTEPAKTEPQPASPGKELVEASKEAESGKEEDEEAQFKYSASVRWLADKTGMSKETAYWVALSINFLIVAGFIGWAVKKSAPIHFRERTASIRKQLEEARAASEDANRRLADIGDRLARLDSEIGVLRSAADRDPAAEEQRLRAAAEEDKQKIVTAAEQEIASAAKMARAELKRYTAELAVALAEKKIQVTPQTDQALVHSFVEDLGEEGVGGKS